MRTRRHRPDTARRARDSSNDSVPIRRGDWCGRLGHGAGDGGGAGRTERDAVGAQPEHATRIASSRDNPRLAGVRLAPEIIVTSDLARAARADMLLIAVPAQHLRGAVNMLASHLEKPVPIIACAKGIEHGTHKFMTDVIAEAAPHAQPAILSGPSFADDVARGLPTAVTLAAKDDALASAWYRRWARPTFRPYHTTDVRGVEIGGAAKNVLAIAVGIAVGRKLGASAQAALTTRGFAELTRLGRALGARSETLTGLSGLGDLILTCSSPQSRNFALGLALGRGEQPPARQACRRRVHRAGADRARSFAQHRDAGIGSGRVDPERPEHDRRRDLGADDATLQGRGMNDGVLAGEIRTIGVVLGSAGGERRQGRSLDRRAQLHRAPESRRHEEGRQGVLLSFQRGQGDRRHRGDCQGSLPRSDRQDGKIRLRRHQGRQAVEEVR